MAKELEPLNETSTEVALPSLYDPVEVDDIQLPNVKLMYPLSEFVAKGRAKPDDVTLAFGNDDPAPQKLIGDGRESFVGFVLDRDKTAARAVPGEDFEWQKERDYNDPYSQDVWFFYLAIPEFEALIPARQMLWKAAGAPAARQINTMIARAGATGKSDPIAIKFTVAHKKSKNGRHTYAFLQAQPAEMTAVREEGTYTKEDLDTAREMYGKMRVMKARYRSSDNEPDFSDQPEL